MVKYFRLFRKNKERIGTARHVLCFQIRRCLPLQRKTETEEKAYGNYMSTIIYRYNIYVSHKVMPSLSTIIAINCLTT